MSKTLQEEIEEFNKARRAFRDSFVKAYPHLGPFLVRLSHLIYGKPEK